MYLADAVLRSTSRDPKLSELRVGLEAAELFAVEASAMTLCHELRLEAPGQVERIAEIVCSQSIPIFAEVSTKVLIPLLKRVMFLPDELAAEIAQKFPRLGVLMVPDNGGLVLTLAWINSGIGFKKWSDDWREHLVGVGSWRVHLNASEQYPFPSAEAMIAAEFHRPEVTAIMAPFRQAAQSNEEAHHMAWMAHRLLYLCDIPDQNAHGWDGILRSVATATAIALGAILQVEAPELDRKKRPSPSTRQRRHTSITENRPVDDRLSIVTLQLTDPEMQRWYETPAETERRNRRSTARHLVRGHVFATRWGGIAWRKPHWRGDPSRKVLHRVK